MDFDESFSPLHLAAYNDYVDEVERLVAAGATIDSENRLGLTPVHMAAFARSSEVMSVLVRLGAIVTLPPVCSWSDVFGMKEVGLCLDILKVLVESGANVSAANAEGNTAMHAASKDGRIEILDYLISVGGNVNACNLAGNTPVFWACMAGHKDAVVTLAERGANVAISNADGIYPIHVATEGNHLDVLDVLVKYGSNVDIPQFDGLSPAHIAAERGFVGSLQRLAKLGADLNYEDCFCDTPAHRAVVCGNSDALRALACLGVDIAATDAKDETLLHRAVKSGQTGIISVLVDLGADVMARDEVGNTALHVAAQCSQATAVKILVQLGADVDDDKSDREESPILIASLYNDKEIHRGEISRENDPHRFISHDKAINTLTELANQGANVWSMGVLVTSSSATLFAEVISFCQILNIPSSPESCELFSLTKLLCAIFSFCASDNESLNDANLVVEADRATVFIGQTFIDIFPDIIGTGLISIFSFPFLKRRKIVLFACRYLMMSLQVDGNRMTGTSKVRRYVELVCLCLNDEMLRDLLALRLTDKASYELRRFTIDGDRQLEVGLIEEFVAFSSSRFLSTDAIHRALKMHADT
jgi:ankyrin repeat protein